MSRMKQGLYNCGRVTVSFPAIGLAPGPTRVQSWLAYGYVGWPVGVIPSCLLLSVVYHCHDLRAISR
ncbi:hypothetical protein F5X97DRAFT_309658 [Nemania serpens]|nr:hypothetical protein F5X97DRAFT_309658 [Nemania serpens]